MIINRFFPTLGAAVLLTMSVPNVNATSVTLDFTGSSVAGTIAASGVGSSQTVTEFQSVPYNMLVVSGAPTGNGLYTLTNTSLSFNTTTDLLTLSGEVSGLAGFTSSQTLETIQLSGGLTGITNSGESQFTLNTPNKVASVTTDSLLLSDLGLTGYSASLSSLGTSGEGHPNGSGIYQAYSQNLVVAQQISAAPEPVSILLTGAGFIALGCIRRSRRTAK